MATKITVALEDDLDGGPASETVRFGLGGAQYEIDLNKKNARAFRKKLTPFVEHARQAGPGQRRGPARTTSSRQRSADIRAWAKATGLAVSDRGRIPASVVDQYEATTRRPLRTPGHHRPEPICSDGLWPRPASNGVPVGPSDCPSIAAWGARQAEQYQAARPDPAHPTLTAMTTPGLASARPGGCPRSNPVEAPRASGRDSEPVCVPRDCRSWKWLTSAVTIPRRIHPGVPVPRTRYFGWVSKLQRSRIRQRRTAIDIWRKGRQARQAESLPQHLPRTPAAAA